MKRKLSSYLMSVPINHLLSLILLALLLPSIVIVVNSGFQERNKEKKHIEDKLRQLAEFVADNQQDAVMAAERTAHLLSDLPEVLNPDAKTIQPVMAELMRTNPQIENIIIADSTGRVIASAAPHSKPLSIANHRCFINAKRTRRTTSGEYDAEMQANCSVICFGFPSLTKQGDFRGLILIEFGSKLYKNILEKTIYPPNCNISLFDHKGVIIYSHLYPHLIGKNDRSENFSLMLKAPEDRAFFESEGNDGLSRLFCFIKLRLKDETTPYLYLRVGLPTDDVYTDINNKFLFEVLALAAVTFVSFLFAWQLGKHLIVNRIKRLNSASQALAENNFDICIADTGGAELGELAKSFNQMIDQLRSREESRLIYEEELRSANFKFQALNKKIETAREEEQRYLARELHDKMGQALTGLNLDMNWLVAQLDQETVQKLNMHFLGMHFAMENMIAMVRSITARLTPPLLDNLGLAPAIGHYVNNFELKSGIACHLMLDEDTENCLDEEDNIAIFRILQEALTNVARHADADEVAVSLCITEQFVVFEVADNGKGATVEKINSTDAFGMLGMKERAKKRDGTLNINTNPGGGMIVRLEIPKQRRGNNENIGD